ncbi:MAG: glycosyltransferase [Fluviicola sp.]|nr:glycosyltransferase [Fluviicola sp.]
MKKNILYFHTGLSSFVEKDIQILEEHYAVTIYCFNVRDKWKTPFELIRQFFFLLKSRKSTIIVSQFGGFHTVLPSFFTWIGSRRSVIVLGGTDCVSFPSINYGNFNRLFLGMATSFSLKRASLLLPVHDSLVKYDYTYQPNDYPQQGYLAHRPRIKTPFEVVYNGYDSSTWTIGQQEREPLSFVTIGAGLGSRFGISLKGIDLIVDIAKLKPECAFYIVGGIGLQLDDLPKNLYLLDKIPNNELNSFLQTKQFYLQLSMSEGFPNALCEAMLSGCIPIVSNVGAMPFIVGNDGYVLNHKSVVELSGILNRISQLRSGDLEQSSQNVHKTISDRFTLQKRNETLKASINQLAEKEV